MEDFIIGIFAVVFVAVLVYLFVFAANMVMKQIDYFRVKNKTDEELPKERIKFDGLHHCNEDEFERRLDKLFKLLYTMATIVFITFLLFWLIGIKTSVWWDIFLFWIIIGLPILHIWIRRRHR